MRQTNRLTDSRCRSLAIGDFQIGFREGGDPESPALLLLHGFPANSIQYRGLIADLSDRFYLIAPDFPGFGLSGRIDPDLHECTFEKFAELIEKLLMQMGIKKYGLFVQDCGGPVGFRIYQRNPEALEWLIVQNSKAFEVEFTKSWDCYRTALWINRPMEIQGPFDFIKMGTINGLEKRAAKKLMPIVEDHWLFQDMKNEEPGQLAINVNLYNDYSENVAFYNSWHEFIKVRQPKTIIFWEGHDLLFKPIDGETFMNYLPDAEIHWLDAGRLAVEIHHSYIARELRKFYNRLTRDD